MAAGGLAVANDDREVAFAVLAKTLAGLEQMLRRLIGEDIEIVAELAPDLGLVQADPAQLDQVIMNLIVNARDAQLSLADRAQPVSVRVA